MTTTRVFAITAPRKIEESSAVIRQTVGSVVLKPLLTSVCSSDMYYYFGERPKEVLKKAYPLVPLHEAVAIAKSGAMVVPVPNIPGSVQNKNHKCPACQPLGVGENYCPEAKFCSSNTEGFCRTAFSHPEACVVEVPKAVPPETAVLAELCSVAFHAAHSAFVDKGLRVGIIGDGPMGSVQAAITAALGVKKKDNVVFGHHSDKLTKLQTFATTVNTQTARSEHANSFDVVFECVGGLKHAAALNEAVDLLVPGGTFVMLGLSDEPQPLALRPLMRKRITIMESFRSSRAHLEQTLQLMTDARVQSWLKNLITEKVRITDARSIDSAFNIARNAKGKTVMDWSGME